MSATVEAPSKLDAGINEMRVKGENPTSQAGRPTKAPTGPSVVNRIRSTQPTLANAGRKDQATAVTLILLDLHLPDMSGDEILATLRADPRTADIPVVVVSADATKSRIADLLNKGAHAYLTKPLVIREFLDAVDNVVSEEHWPSGSCS